MLCRVCHVVCDVRCVVCGVCMRRHACVYMCVCAVFVMCCLVCVGGDMPRTGVGVLCHVLCIVRMVCGAYGMCARGVRVLGV